MTDAVTDAMTDAMTDAVTNDVTHRDAQGDGQAGLATCEWLSNTCRSTYYRQFTDCVF
jgi:hypothetical protein